MSAELFSAISLAYFIQLNKAKPCSCVNLKNAQVMTLFQIREKQS